MKAIIPVFTLLAGAAGTVLSLTSDQFTYQYQIIANSKKSADTLQLYYLKEELIDTYEKYFLDVDANQITSMIKANISKFKVRDNLLPYYKNGFILVVVGDGKGLSMSGSLRKSDCDSTTIREKFFILDLFS